jgi:serine phosphatase RsbU (regulator of sigma subunit)
MDFSIEDVARTTDEAMVRRRFDQRNLVWWFVLVIFFSLVSVIAVYEDRRYQDTTRFLSANGSTILAVIVLFLLRDVHRTNAGQAHGRATWHVGQWIRNHISASVLTYLALQYIACLGFGGKGWVGWVMSFPFLMLAFRMLVSELVLLHVFLFGSGLAMAFLTQSSGKEMNKFLAGAISINVICLAVELFASHRLRKEITADWSERRTQAREQIRMRDELRYARELQLSMLPERAPRLDWVDVASVCIPATEVGGDYYDYFVDGDRIALVCGDVAGHGMASGLVLAAIRTGFTLLRDSLGDPAAVLRRLHDLVAETSRRRMLVTVSVVLLDQTTREATIASAGHPPVIVRRADGSLETINLFAPPLGVRLPVDIPQRRLSFVPGDVFVLHSDGIYETRDEDGEVYGLERLARIIDEHGTAPADQLRDAIVNDVDDFRGATEQDDDVTVVVCRIV